MDVVELGRVGPFRLGVIHLNTVSVDAACFDVLRLRTSNFKLGGTLGHSLSALNGTYQGFPGGWGERGKRADKTVPGWLDRAEIRPDDFGRRVLAAHSQSPSEHHRGDPRRQLNRGPYSAKSMAQIPLRQTSAVICLNSGSPSSRTSSSPNIQHASGIATDGCQVQFPIQDEIVKMVDLRSPGYSSVQTKAREGLCSLRDQVCPAPSRRSAAKEDVSTSSRIHDVGQFSPADTRRLGSDGTSCRSRTCCHLIRTKAASSNETGNTYL